MRYRYGVRGPITTNTLKFNRSPSIIYNVSCRARRPRNTRFSIFVFESSTVHISGIWMAQLCSSIPRRVSNDFFLSYSHSFLTRLHTTPGYPFRSMCDIPSPGNVAGTREVGFPCHGPSFNSLPFSRSSLAVAVGTQHDF